MITLGRFNSLNVIKTSPVGAILDGGDSGSILLTADQKNFKSGDTVDAFIYLDSEGELAATLTKPLVQLDEVAWLKIVDSNDIGGFVDWGLPKDLFIPFAEQHCPLEIGRHILVKVYIDNQNRLAGTTRMDHVIEDQSSGLKEKEKVSLIIADKTELGFKAIINHQFWGLIFKDEIFQNLHKGDQLDGYIKKIREDNKVDLSLKPIGYSQQLNDSLAQSILDELERNNGILALNDKSSPKAIRAAFSVSKGAFKKSCGALYKRRLITFTEGGIKKVEPE